METKCLTLKGTTGRVDTTYIIKINIPGKSDLVKQLSQFPHHIVSEEETTFKTGPLAYTPHSVHLAISAYQYREPEIGVYVKVNPNRGDLITVSGIKGNYEFNVAKNEHGNHNFSFVNRGPGKSNEILSANRDDLTMYDYWQSSYCNCPSYPSELKIFITVSKQNYCTIVPDCSTEIRKTMKMLKGIDAKPYFMNESCSDVTVIVGDSETKFPAHKIILSSRSKYFFAMFNTQMRESMEGLVTIRDTDSTLMTELFRFIYTDEILNIESHATELLLLSDKYEIDDLKVFCMEYLMGHITIENALEMYDVANSIGGGDRLKEKAKQVIMWNRKTFITNMESMQMFTRKYPELFFELLTME